MKRSEEILGLSIISINEGEELGTVKDFVIDPAGGSIVAMVVEDGKKYYAAKLLPFSAVVGLGEYAVTVESSSNIVAVTAVPEYEKLLQVDIKVVGTKVLTKTGQIQGKVTEIIVDETGKIITCEIEEMSGQISNIPAEQVITFGKDVLIVTGNDIAAVQPQKKSEPVVEAVPIVEAQSAAAPEPKVEEPVAPVQPEIQEAAPVIEPAAAPEPIEEPIPQPEPEPVKEEPAPEAKPKADDRHRKYLLGKKASRRIETDNGVVIVDEGGEITEEVLQKAKLAGKFVELSMNIQ
ncbi:MAG: PRC-barrel domain-containing protein [Pelosinus sp.]|nr:PRC-barrel domain-containing protein [Pelosinus sp.]